MIKAGSTVYHKPTREQWFILGVNTDKNMACVAGYPKTIANLSDCVLVEEGNGLTVEELRYREKEFGFGWDE